MKPLMKCKVRFLRSEIGETPHLHDTINRFMTLPESRNHGTLEKSKHPYFLNSLSRSSISSELGNRPLCNFEKINSPSTVTSNAPPLPGTKVASMPNVFSSASAKLAACGL